MLTKWEAMTEVNDCTEIQQLLAATDIRQPVFFIFMLPESKKDAKTSVHINFVILFGESIHSEPKTAVIKKGTLLSLNYSKHIVFRAKNHFFIEFKTIADIILSDQESDQF